MEPRRETWDSFWARTLRIDFFEGQWEMYNKVADKRAEWIEQTFEPDPQRPVLSIACGEGGIELALSRRGYNVTGIDRSATFIHHAREQAKAEGLSATFLVGDLRQRTSLTAGNGLVYCFDTLGLLGGAVEASLIKRMVASLTREGVLLVDNPQRESQKPSRTWGPLSKGHLLMETRWDAATGMLHIEPLFIEENGERVILADPYDEEKADETGVTRYVYRPDELVKAVDAAGMPAQVVKHQRGGYYMVVGRRSLAPPPAEDTFTTRQR